MNSFIKSLMEEKGLKQKELAAILGISPAAVNQRFKGETCITVDNLFSLSKLFHVTVDELLEGKRKGESLEDKWKREYDINEEAARTALINGEKEKVLKYFAALSKANNKFFVLFEKKIIGKISEDELKEWEYLKQFYDVNMYRSPLLNDVHVSRVDNISDMITDILADKLGSKNSKAIVWELQKIYHITRYGVGITADEEVIPEDDYYDFYGEDPLEYLKNDEEIFFAVYNILSPIEKDTFLTTEFENKRSAEYLYKLIKLDGNILFTPKDLNIANYDYSDLEGLEGEIKPVSELDKAQAVIYEVYDNYSHTTYEQYQALINFPRIWQIEMAVKYKKKNPVMFWEYVKNNVILI